MEWLSSLSSKIARRRNGGAAAIDGKAQADLDRHLVLSLSKARIPSWRQLKQVGRFLSRGERWAIRASLALALSAAAYWALDFYQSNLKTVPLAGSSYAEALVGSPKYVNPLYSSVSDVDADLTSLVYSSLYRRGPDGKLQNDIADSLEQGADGKEYTVRIKPGARWHDGAVLTADDVVFTFTAIKDPLYKSPLRAGFNGVSAERMDELTVKFKLAEPYAAFLELLTFGILPSHLWARIAPEAASLAELNLKPVGSGPFKFSQLTKDKTGFVRDYTLVANREYYGQPPYLDLRFVFYAGFEEAVAALNDNTVDGLSYLPVGQEAAILTPKSYNFHKLNLPQLTAIFLNQARNESLKDKAVRQALAYGIDRERIVRDIFKGDATLADGPILASSFAYNANARHYALDAAKADELLNSAGWAREEVTAEMAAKAEEDSASADPGVAARASQVLAVGEGSWRKKGGNYLVIDLKTADRNQNAAVVAAIAADWEALGVKTMHEALPIARVQSEVVAGRQFDALFYGQVLGADPDPYAFWHSSQTGEGGFNIAGYANKEVDQLLEDARLVSDQGERQAKYLRFQELIAEDEPAIFMYSPVYTYVQSNKVKGFSASNIAFARDRLAGAAAWYIKTGKRLVWPE